MECLAGTATHTYLAKGEGKHVVKVPLHGPLHYFYGELNALTRPSRVSQEVMHSPLSPLLISHSLSPFVHLSTLAPHTFHSLSPTHTSQISPFTPLTPLKSHPLQPTQPHAHLSTLIPHTFQSFSPTYTSQLCFSHTPHSLSPMYTSQL